MATSLATHSWTYEGIIYCFISVQSSQLLSSLLFYVLNSFCLRGAYSATRLTPFPPHRAGWHKEERHRLKAGWGAWKQHVAKETAAGWGRLREQWGHWEQREKAPEKSSGRNKTWRPKSKGEEESKAVPISPPGRWEFYSYSREKFLKNVPQIFPSSRGHWNSRVDWAENGVDTSYKVGKCYRRQIKLRNGGVTSFPLFCYKDYDQVQPCKGKFTSIKWSIFCWRMGEKMIPSVSYSYSHDIVRKIK